MWIDILFIFILSLFALANLSLAIYVFRKNPKEKLNKTFFYFGVVIFSCIFSTIVLKITQNMFWMKMCFITGTSIPIAGVSFSYTLANKKIGKLLKSFLIISASTFYVLIILNFLLVKSVTSFTTFGFTANFGPFIFIWFIYLFCLIFMLVYTPFKAIKNVNDLRKKQILYYFFGVALYGTWKISTIVILPYLGFSNLIFASTLGTIFLLGFTSYAIIKYNLMNIRSLLFYSLIYSLTIVAIIAFLLLLMSTGSFLFAQSTTWPVYVMAFLISVILFYIGRLFFLEKRDLEKTKVNLTESLKKSEESRLKVEAIEKMKTEFVSLAAHQLRTPLSVIKWSANSLKDKKLGKLAKKQTDIVESISDNNEKLILIVNNLLDITHLEEGVYLYNKTKVNIEELVISSINDCKEIAQKRKIKINYKTQGTFPEIMLDSVKLKLAIQNFIDNAIKYSFENSKIEILLTNSENKILFKIKDFGIGIPENQQDKIFSKFFRGQNAIKLREIGSGLGLFLSKNIIEAHGGKVWFQSEENKGTTFFFNLPIDTPASK